MILITVLLGLISICLLIQVISLEIKIDYLERGKPAKKLKPLDAEVYRGTSNRYNKSRRNVM